MNSALSDKKMMNDRQSDDKEFLIKIYDNNLLVICDKDIINKEFKTIKFNKRFYDGFLVDRKEILKYLDQFDNVNIFGNKIVDFLIENGYIKDFVEIEGEKFTIIVKIRR